MNPFTPRNSDPITREELRRIVRDAVFDALLSLKVPRKGPAMLTVEEVAELARTTPHTVQAHARLGKIAGAKKIGREWVFNIDKISRYLGFKAGEMPMPNAPDDTAVDAQELTRRTAIAWAELEKTAQGNREQWERRRVQDPVGGWPPYHPPEPPRPP